MPSPLSVELEQSGGDLTLTLPGPEVNAPTMQELVRTCEERMRFDQATNFIFDLAEVEYLDSACIGLLVELLRDIEPMRGRIALVGCRANVAFLFKATRLDSVFALCDDRDEAEQAIHGRR